MSNINDLVLPSSLPELIWLGEPVIFTFPREMTAEDLGLYWGGAEWRHLPVKDAPYSFWLGADHG